jgi:hypothetical protein
LGGVVSYECPVALYLPPQVLGANYGIYLCSGQHFRMLRKIIVSVSGYILESGAD